MVPGLSWAQCMHLAESADGAPSGAPERRVRRCELQGWLRGGRLTDEGEQVVRRPPKVQAPEAVSYWGPGPTVRSALAGAPKPIGDDYARR